MPKKKKEIGPKEQAEKFAEAVQEMVDAGELDPIEADKEFEKALEGIARHPPKEDV